MTHSASAGFEQMGETRHRRCGGGFKSRWSPWEVGAMVAGFVVFWPLGLLALFLKWKNGEMWSGAADSKAPWSSFKAPDFSKWKAGPSYGFSGMSGSGNAAFDDYILVSVLVKLQAHILVRISCDDAGHQAR